MRRARVPSTSVCSFFRNSKRSDELWLQRVEERQPPSASRVPDDRGRAAPNGYTAQSDAARSSLDLQCCKSCGMLIRKGKGLLEPMGSAERQMLAREPAWRLTCRSVVAPLEQDEEMVIRIRPDLDNIMFKW